MFHVLARGDRRELIVLGDDDRWMFLRTLGEMAKRTTPPFPALRSGPTAGSGVYPKSKLLAEKPKQFVRLSVIYCTPSNPDRQASRDAGVGKAIS